MNIYYRYERVFLSFWSVILFLSLPVLSTFGGVIGSAYDSNSWKNDLYTIDPKTGNVSFLNSLDIENGDFIWRLSVMDSIAYFQSSSNTLHGIDITTGTIVSSVLVSPMQAIVSGVNGLLIGVDYNSTTQQNQISSINPRTGSTIVLSSFSFDTGWWNGNLVRAGGSLIAQSTSGTLYRFDINSGEMLSTTLGLSPFQSIVASEEGTLVIVQSKYR